MKNQRNLILFSALSLFFLLALWSTATSSMTLEDEREFDYIAGSENGPMHRGQLRKEWEACNKGEMQSLIDLSSWRVEVIPNLGEIERSYKLLQWDAGGVGSIKINGSQYFLQQFHWHSPSEHTINGKRYELELHMVHVLLYETGQPDAFLSKLIENLRSMVNQKGERQMGMINPTEIKMGGKSYLTYMGSLTVPPCTKGVMWIIGTISKDQIKLLREAVHDYVEENARPVQPLNRREIHLYQPNEGATPN
ncbi:hypothetical protein EUGRSUZ_A01625 [Eucalyptus grandis]|uniref:Uncharacterized protein n=2 Tax=Eucalyptus grandis TaxID=71139 RepID=A0ACC3M3W2_EUCGR|nr:hypothetical protein EUGRSUZ_A01625 [Eucalyptus grandis]